MEELNALSYRLFYDMLETVEEQGYALGFLTWWITLYGCLAMFLILRKYSMRGRWRASLTVGGIALAGHLLDYFVTIKISPDLYMEANPLWTMIIENMGMGIAKWYGFTSKIMFSILSAELFAFYLIQREHLFPERATSFLTFWQRFGRASDGYRLIHFPNIGNFFAFLFALVSPFSFYIAFLNSIVETELFVQMPSMPIMLCLYLISLTLIYLLVNYESFRRQAGQALSPAIN